MRYNPNPILFVMGQLSHTCPGFELKSTKKFVSEVFGQGDVSEGVAELIENVPEIVNTVKKSLGLKDTNVKKKEFVDRMAAAKAAKKAETAAETAAEAATEAADAASTAAEAAAKVVKNVN